jgi:hypothetical protein
MEIFFAKVDFWEALAQEKVDAELIRFFCFKFAVKRFWY